MKSEWLRAFGFFFVVSFLGLVAWVALPKLLGAASGPEGELLTLIKERERDGLHFQVAGFKDELRATSAHYDRITINASPDGQSAEAIATLDFNGGVGGTKVSSLGLEKMRFVRKDRQWQVQGTLAPRLIAIVEALERRRVALESGDRAQLSQLTGHPDAGLSPEVETLLGYSGRQYVSRAWYLRSERDEVTVTEDSTVRGATADRPIHEEKSRRLTLIQSTGGEFFFPTGLL